MAKHSDKTVTEIATEASAPVEDVEEEMPDVDPESIPDPRYDDNALKYIAIDSADHYPSVQVAREEAEIPEHIQAKNLIGVRILIARATPQKAALPDTGELRDGYFCACINLESKTPFTTWLGQSALVRDLGRLSVPFQTTIQKHGRSYRFD